MPEPKLNRELSDLLARHWEKLSDSAQDTVSDLVVMLAGRFTGEITLKCIEGGVREFRDSRSRRSGDLGTLSGKEK